MRLAEQLREKSQEIEALEARNASEREGAEACRSEWEHKVERLQEEIVGQKERIRALEVERTNLNNQTGIARESLERHQMNQEELQKRIRFLEQELESRSKTNAMENATGYEQIVKSKDDMIADLQAKIAELEARQPATMDDDLKVEMAHQEEDEDLRSQLEDAQTTIIAFKAEIHRLKDQLDRSQSTSIEYLRTVFLRFMQKPECRQQSLELLKMLLQFTQEEQATFQAYN